MHLLRVESRSIDGTAEAVDLGHTPAEIVALSFTDTDLAVLAAAWDAGRDRLPSLRLASLAALRHPYSVDLYIEKILSQARFILVRLLGGMDYWRYGVDELAVLARASGIPLAIVPGDHRADARLDEASTVPPAALRLIASYFNAGGIENIGSCLRFVAAQVPRPVAAVAGEAASRGGEPQAAPESGVMWASSAPPSVGSFGMTLASPAHTPASSASGPAGAPSAGRQDASSDDPPNAPAKVQAPGSIEPPAGGLASEAADRAGPSRQAPSAGIIAAAPAPPAGLRRNDEPAAVVIDPPPARPVDAFGCFAPAMRAGPASAPLALIVFYRTWMLAADTDPVVALADAMASRGFRVVAVAVTSLKDQAAIRPLRAQLAAQRPDIVLNLTGFSARLDDAGSVLDEAGAPVLQLALSGGSHAQWADSQRGLGPADLAMNVVLPELDGRIFAGAVSFKAETPRNEVLQFTRLVHQPAADGVGHAADLAAAWVHLARTPRPARRLACILSDYPAKAGRTGYAVGLDTPRSVLAIAGRLAEAGFAIEPPSGEAELVAALTQAKPAAVFGVADYAEHLATLPRGFVDQVRAAWGDPSDDPAVRDGLFCFRFVRAGKLLIAVQPDRGDTASRKAEYHDALLPPRHLYVAFYLWLRAAERVHAVIHCGTHGTLEWLPGKATALSASCGPRAVLGPVPLIYPFIVNNPGEAAQAKRRTAAVTIGHLTPPLIRAGTHGATAELEGLFDEYAEAQSLDPRRAARLAELIMARARETGLAAESGIAPGENAETALIKLDAWLCDIKDMRIGDGLHVFGQPPDVRQRAATAALLSAQPTAAGIGAAPPGHPGTGEPGAAELGGTDAADPNWIGAALQGQPSTAEPGGTGITDFGGIVANERGNPGTPNPGEIGAALQGQSSTAEPGGTGESGHPDANERGNPGAPNPGEIGTALPGHPRTDEPGGTGATDFGGIVANERGNPDAADSIWIGAASSGHPGTGEPGGTGADPVDRLIASCGEAEMQGLLAALDGRFVPPGPAGAPDRGRTDVLPTGRNLFGIDPRAVPTRTAWEIGRRTADAVTIRYAQDHGDWPRRIVLDVWGSATMRTGGDDLAQAFALLGVQPRWDAGTSRVGGFDILPLAVLNRPRVDVTLRVSGLFRDVFPSQIALFDQVVRAVAALEEAADDNPLAASVRAGGDHHRLFGAAPGAYGIGLAGMLAGDASADRAALGEAYLRATSHAYGADNDGTFAGPAFRARVAQAEAFVHVQDMQGQDVLDADAFAEHEGGFAAAAARLGNHPALYHADTTDPDRSRVRTVREELARVVRARATNPRWIAGQMAHGFRGAAEIAQTVDNFFTYAALADLTEDRQFDLLFDATLGDETVRTFLLGANPAAAWAIAERFEQAIRRGLWRTRRNATTAILAGMRTRSA